MKPQVCLHLMTKSRGHTCASSGGLHTTAVPLKGECTRQHISKSSVEMGPHKSLTVLIPNLLACQPGFSTWRPCHVELAPVALLWAHIWQQAGDILKDVFVCSSVWFPSHPHHADTLGLKYDFFSGGQVPPGSQILLLLMRGCLRGALYWKRWPRSYRQGPALTRT